MSFQSLNGKRFNFSFPLLGSHDFNITTKSFTVCSYFMFSHIRLHYLRSGNIYRLQVFLALVLLELWEFHPIASDPSPFFTFFLIMWPIYLHFSHYFLAVFQRSTLLRYLLIHAYQTDFAFMEQSLFY